MLNFLLRRVKKGIPTNSYYRAMMKSMLTIGFFLPFIPMILVSCIMLYQFHVAYKEYVNRHFKEAAQKGRQTIDHFLEENSGDIRFLARKYDFEGLREESFLKNILRDLQWQRGPVFVNLEVIDDKGIPVAYTGGEMSPEVSYLDAAWYREVIKADSVICDVSSGSRGLPRLIIAVRGDRNGRRWILKGTIDNEVLNRLMEDLRLGETGVVFVLNRDGICLTRQTLNIHPAKKTFEDFLGISENTRGKMSIVQRTDGSGDKNVYVTTPLRNVDWLLVNQQRASEAFSSLKRAKTITIVVILIVVLCIAANAFRLTKKMVTRIEEADKKKEKMNEQVFQTKKLASIGELAIGVAHEINNPVAVMVEKAGWIEDLLEEEEFQKSKNLDEFKGALKQIKTQGKRCGDINYKLLSFARKTGSKREKVRLNELIEDSIAVARKRADLSNVEVSANIQNDLPPMEVPQTELQRVLLNLITNALDAMQDTGGTLSISAQLENENIVIDVSDNGPGIPEENLSRIFDPFFTTKPFGEGTGLGLSICYGIIKELGGDISVKSEIETGTTFRVILPLSRDRPAKAEGGFETRDSYE